MNREERNAYNRRKQKEYRDLKRGAPPHHKPTFVKYTITARVLNIHVPTEEILRQAGHCSYCGMLLESEYHQKHPLVGCQVAARNDNYGKN